MKSRPVVASLTLDQRRNIREAFEIMDTAKSGFIELRDVKVILRALGFEPKKDEARMIMMEIDKRSMGQGGLSKIINGMPIRLPSFNKYLLVRQGLA